MESVGWMIARFAGSGTVPQESPFTFSQAEVRSQKTRGSLSRLRGIGMTNFSFHSGWGNSWVGTPNPPGFCFPGDPQTDSGNKL